MTASRKSAKLSYTSGLGAKKLLPFVLKMSP
jgi:hypothetical protein